MDWVWVVNTIIGDSGWTVSELESQSKKIQNFFRYLGEYGKGECSESCTTFKNYVQLGVNKNFTIRNIEVWAVGEKPVKSTVKLIIRKFLKFDFYPLFFPRFI